MCCLFLAKYVDYYFEMNVLKVDVPEPSLTIADKKALCSCVK